MYPSTIDIEGFLAACCGAIMVVVLLLLLLLLVVVEKVPPLVVVLVVVPLPSSRASAPMPLCNSNEAFSSSKETRRDLRSAEASPWSTSCGMGYCCCCWWW